MQGLPQKPSTPIGFFRFPKLFFLSQVLLGTPGGFEVFRAQMERAARHTYDMLVCLCFGDPTIFCDIPVGFPSKPNNWGTLKAATHVLHSLQPLRKPQHLEIFALKRICFRLELVCSFVSRLLSLRVEMCPRSWKSRNLSTGP